MLLLCASFSCKLDLSNLSFLTLLQLHLLRQSFNYMFESERCMKQCERPSLTRPDKPIRFFLLITSSLLRDQFRTTELSNIAQEPRKDSGSLESVNVTMAGKSTNFNLVIKRQSSSHCKLCIAISFVWSFTSSHVLNCSQFAPCTEYTEVLTSTYL